MNTSSRSLILAISIFFALSASISAAPGDLDPTFGVGGKVTVESGGFYDVAIQPNGKIVTVGLALAGSEAPQIAVARYNSDGSPDTTFGGTGKVLIDHYQSAVDVAIQPDGKIVVASRDPDGEVFGELIRLNSDGSLDTSFGTNGIVSPLALPSVAAILPDGKLLIASADTLFRLNANGSSDMTFSPCRPRGSTTHYPHHPHRRSESVIQPDGRILTAFNASGSSFGSSFFGVFRCNADGTLDTGFGSGGVVITSMSSGIDVAQSIALQRDGKIVVTGQSQSKEWSEWKFTVLRYNPNGSLDSGFGTGGILTTPTGNYFPWFPPPSKVVLQTDGKILVATTFVNGSSRFDLVRYNPDGSLDTTFTPMTNGNVYAHSVAIQADGKIVVAGSGQNGNDFYGLVVRFQGDYAGSTSCPNPIDCPDFFIRQQYRDFLVREAEPAGLQFYLDILNGCHPSDTECINYTRGALSANFFRSPEFQQKGAYVANLYNITLGQRPKTVAELNDATKVERPGYAEFVTDLATLSAPTDTETNARKDQLAGAWLQRAEVQQILPSSLTNQQFVQKLETIAGVTLANEGALISSLNSGATRGAVLRAVAESPEVMAKFYIPNFVTMEYFGYLRRDPEDCHGSPDPANCGYIFHNSRFNTPGADPDLIENIIVRGFIESPEYRQRFGP